MAYSLIRSDGGRANTGTGSTVGANLIVLCLADDGGGSASDNQGNTWTAAGSASTSVAGVKCRLYYCYNPTTNSGHQFINSLSYGYVGILAFSGSVASPLDQTAGGFADSVTTVQGASVTPTETLEVCVAAIALNGNGSSPSADSGFSTDSISAAIFGVTFGGALAYKIQTSAALVQPTWTFSNTADPAVRNATFKASGGVPDSGSSTNVFPAICGDYGPSLIIA